MQQQAQNIEKTSYINADNCVEFYFLGNAMDSFS